MSKRETVRVRIAVAVDEEGRWNAAGWRSTNSDSLMQDIAVEGMDSDSIIALHWIEANIPLPIAEVIEGEVTHE